MAEGGEPVDPNSAFVLQTPMHRQMSAVTAWSIEKAHQFGLPFIWMPHPGDALIDRARSIQATWFLEKAPYNYAILVDSDIQFEPRDLLRLFQHLQSGTELIGGVYTVRQAQQLAHHGINNKILLDGNVTEVAYLSTGFMGMSKGLLQKIVDKLKLPLCHKDEDFFRCYPFFESGRFLHEGRWIFRSEDWDFCDKARAVGVKPLLDTAIRLGHEGTKLWTISDLPDVKAQEEAAARARASIVVPGIVPRQGQQGQRELVAPRLVVPRNRSR